MGKSGGGGSTQTIQKSDPWTGVQPNLLQLYSGAANQYQSGGPQYYPNNTVAPLSNATTLGQEAMGNRAMMGSPLTGAAQQQALDTLNGGYMNTPATQGLQGLAGTDFMGQNPGVQGLQNTASGQYLNSNPYLGSMFNTASQQVGQQFRQNVMPGVASMFAGAGRYGSNQMTTGLDQAQQQYGNTLNNLANSIYGQNYSNERNLQQQAQGQLGTLGLGSMGLQNSVLSNLGDQYARERAFQQQTMQQAPNLANADYNDINQLLGLGQTQDAYTQQLLNADINRWDFNQNRQLQNLQNYNALLQGAPGGTTQANSQTTMPHSALQGALGGGMMGYQLGSTFGAGALGGPYGAIAGALLGGLFS